MAPALALRAGLRVLVSSQPQIDVIADSANLSEVTKNFVKVDVILSLVDAISAQELELFLDNLDEPPALLLLSDDDNPQFALFKLPLRAWGILRLDATEEEYLSAVNALNLGLVAADPQLLRLYLGSSFSRGSEDMENPVEELTNREMEVLEFLSEGFANKQIALELKISEHTVKFHVSSIYTKLAVTNRTEAVTIGARLGLITL